MPTTRPPRSPSTRRCVRFAGAEVIEFEADLPAVVRFCGAGGGAADAALEGRARGLQLDASEASAMLRCQYVEELQRSLRVRGFEPISDELQELQTQRRVVELLLAWTAGPEDTEDHKQLAADALLDPRTLQRAQLAKKQLEGRVDDGYAFGRRFLSVATFVETLGSEELLAAAKERGVELPRLDEKQRAAVKAPDRELLGMFGTAEGRPLRALTLRQLVTEAEGRGMLGPGGEKARDSKGKKSKRAWVDMLRPVMAAEVRAAKIREQQEDMLREKLTQVLEKEQEDEQRRRVLEIMQTVVEEDGDCAEPEADDATLCEQSDQKRDKESQRGEHARRYLQALLRTVCIPTEAQEDVVMAE